MVTVTGARTAVVTLPADDEILITREFDAPRELVYRAWTTPELIARWWSGDRGQVTSVEVDLRVGGTWRYVMRTDRGFEVAFHGEYQEVVPNERIVSSEVFEGAPDAPALSTVTFTETAGRTTLSILSRYPSPENRDAVIRSGMESGMQEAFDHLAQVVAALA
jgi:uncharacterized protein YndB with AHSA1/START domain